MLLGFHFLQTLFLKRKMGLPKKNIKNVRKIYVPTDTFTEFEFGDTAANIQRSEGRDQRKRDEEAQREEMERQDARRAETPQPQEGVDEKRARTARSETEIDTEGEGEVDTSQLQFKLKKGYMTNIYLTDLDEEAIV